MKLRTTIGAAGALALCAGVFIGTSPASATPSEKQEICHATSSHTNPYTTNDVNTSSIDEQNNQYLNGHGDHTGPVWYEGISGSWGDIIPPFESPAGTSFPGSNWTPAGQAIFRNGCVPPAPEVPIATPVAPTQVVATECEVLDTYTIPTVTGVIYRVGGVDTPAGTSDLAAGVSVTITALAATGYELAGGTWSWTFTGSAVQPCPVDLPTATPVAPTQVVATECAVLDTYTIPTVTGVIYRVGGVDTPAGTSSLAAGVSVTITAVAATGYELAEGTWSWTFTGSAVQACPVETEALPPVVPPAVVPPAVVPPVTEDVLAAPPVTATQLPSTGTSSWILAALAAALVGAGTGLVRFGRER